MPTPIGHGLAGMAAGWAVAGRAPRGVGRWQAAAFALLAAAPDLDFLVARHRAESHSIGMAAIVATVAVWRGWPLAGSRTRVWWAVFAAWVTHPLLDSLALDRGTPIGLMAFWPFSFAYVQTGLSVFLPVVRDVQTPGFVSYTIAVIVREVVILLPVAAGVWIWRARSKPAGER